MTKRGLIQRLEDSKEEHGQAPCPGRRGFLQKAIFVMGGLAASPALANLNTKKERFLSFYNKHTGETVRAIYWLPHEGYISQSLAEISYILRDHRTDEVKSMDPKLLDQLYILQLKLNPRKPIHIISGYRSPATNAMLRRHSRRVARNSLHMRGMAVDLRIPDRRVSDLYRAALSLKAGGVGYYPRANFIHIDSGAVRTWR